MTKSTITRERLQELAEGQSGFNLRTATHEESQELARMALAAMDSSESVELPLDYLQGHKDGLEWAARLAEANHPDTGDWLYDDPIELAKAIRKGPDMPPAQPVADSEPVIVVGDDGGDALSYRRLIQSFEPGTKLYRHAQPEPAVSAELLHTAASAIEDLLTTNDRTGACVWFDLPFRLRSAANAQQPVVPDVMEPTIEAIKRILPTSNPDEYAACIGADMWNACRAAMLQGADGNSPVITDDVRRMDWLVSKTVDVREPMVYGSHSLFWSQTITDEEDDYHATKLREQIDAAMAAEQAAAPQQEVK